MAFWSLFAHTHAKVTLVPLKGDLAWILFVYFFLCRYTIEIHKQSNEKPWFQSVLWTGELNKKIMFKIYQNSEVINQTIYTR